MNIMQDEPFVYKMANNIILYKERFGIDYKLKRNNYINK